MNIYTYFIVYGMKGRCYTSSFSKIISLVLVLLIKISFSHFNIFRIYIILFFLFSISSNSSITITSTFLSIKSLVSILFLNFNPFSLPIYIYPHSESTLFTVHVLPRPGLPKISFYIHFYLTFWNRGEKEISL